MKSIAKISILLFTLVFVPATPIVAQGTSLILENALRYLGKPYVPHTLDANIFEELIVNKDEVDCTTFVEYVLAETLAESPLNTDSLTEDDFLTKIRYRDGIISGYPSRLHYTSEWISEGIKNGYLKDITQLHTKDSMYVVLSYMTNNPSFYKNLVKSPENIAAMKQVEQDASGKIVRYLPKNQLPNEGLSWIKDGDIICFTSSIYGLDISHMGFAYYDKGKLYLLHASYPKAKVIIDTHTISELLTKNKRWTGIRVIRPIV